MSSIGFGIDVPEDYTSFFPKCCPRGQIYLNNTCQDSEISMENFKFNVSIMCNNVLLGVDDTFEPQNIVYGDPCSEEK